MVLSIKLKKKFCAVYDTDSLLYIPSVEVSNISRCSSKPNKLRDIDSIGCRARNVTIKNGKLTILKIKIVTFIINFGKNNIIRNGQMQVRKTTKIRKRSNQVPQLTKDTTWESNKNTKKKSQTRANRIAVKNADSVSEVLALLSRDSSMEIKLQ